MGRHKSDDNSELTFAPKISDRNRKLELLKIYGSDDTVCCLKNRWSGRSLTNKSSDRGARNYNGLLNLPGYLKATLSKPDLESVDVSVSVAVASLAPLKTRVPAKKLCLGTRLYKDNNIVAKKDDATRFTNFSLRFAEEKCARIRDATSKSAARHEEQRKCLVQDHSKIHYRSIHPYRGRLSPVLSNSESNKKSRPSVVKGANSKSGDNLVWNTLDSKILTSAVNTSSEDEGNRTRSTSQSVTAPSPLKHQSKLQLGAKSNDSLAWSTPDNTNRNDGGSRTRSTQSVMALNPLKHQTKLQLGAKSNDSLAWSTPDNSDRNDGGSRTRSTQSVTSLSPNKHERKFQSPVRCSVEDGPDPGEVDDDEASSDRMLSRTIPQSFYPRLGDNALPAGVGADEVKNAQITAEKAIKQGKIFAIKGSWVVRKALKKRGWVEKSCYKWLPSVRSKKKKRRSSKDKAVNNDSAVDVVKSDSIDGIMSRMVRNYSPTFIWCEESTCIDYRYLNKEQIVNHYARVGSFVTKIGLCKNLRNVAWFDNANALTFFPRCYELSMADEKAEFIDDFRLTACQSIIRHVIENYKGLFCEENIDEEKESSRDEERVGKGGNNSGTKGKGKSGAPTPPSSKPKKKPSAQVDLTIIDHAIQQCERWLGLKAHLDIDRWDDPHRLSDSSWDQILQSCRTIVCSGASIKNAASRVEECEMIAERLREHNPQFDMDGTRNVWIIKPGAQSRGQGILMSNSLDEMLKMSSDSAVKVVQKYIERPLLVYNTKFDIRQWFLVTDWNPLTIWLYKECYLRFCSQQFSLGNFDKAIHLSNVAIQRHCSNGPRSKSLPDDNMWDLETFKHFLSRKGQGQVWVDKIYPGMKKAVTCSLLSVQDEVKDRKASFELYGADFMLTEDLNPWLIEINSSPDLSFSTPITNRMCRNVIEDTIKVVIDRKKDKNCDIGNFELAFKQNPVTVLPYFGTHLTVEGQSIGKPTTITKVAKTVKEEAKLDGEESLFLHKQFLPNS